MCSFPRCRLVFCNSTCECLWVYCTLIKWLMCTYSTYSHQCTCTSPNKDCTDEGETALTRWFFLVCWKWQSISVRTECSLLQAKCSKQRNSRETSCEHGPSLLFLVLSMKLRSVVFWKKWSVVHLLSNMKMDIKLAPHVELVVKHCKTCRTTERLK